MQQVDHGAIDRTHTIASKSKTRPASEEDIARVVTLLKEADLPLDGLQNTKLYVLEHEGSVVGAVGVESYDDVVLLRSLVVDRTWRGRGFGTTLLSRALDDARVSGVKVAYGLTLTIADWLECLGFEEVAKSSIPHPVLASAEFQGACPVSARLFRRMLTSRSSRP
jgi:amino-acid N-acetyltransferase